MRLQALLPAFLGTWSGFDMKIGFRRTMMQDDGVIMRAALSSFENETVMPDREKRAPYMVDGQSCLILSINRRSGNGCVEEDFSQTMP